MPLYQDGTEVRVGDVFWSTRSSSQFSWEITNFDAHQVAWRGVTFGHNGENPVSDTRHWVLIHRKNSAPSSRKSGFSKFIRRIENDDR